MRPPTSPARARWLRRQSPVSNGAAASIARRFGARPLSGCQGRRSYRANTAQMAHTPSVVPVGCLRPSKFSYTSNNSPLLKQLHQQLDEYETAINHVYEVREKYGLRPGFDLDPPSGELVDRMQRVEAAFEAILSHVNDVNAHVARDYVLLRREACGAANALFRAPASEEEEQDKLRTVFTRSPILRQSSQRGLSFRPYPSCELLCRSHILSNSMDLQTLAAPPELYSGEA